jgi:hypothetical protein
MARKSTPTVEVKPDPAVVKAALAEADALLADQPVKAAERPTICGAAVVGSVVRCHRLPMHSGQDDPASHRATLTSRAAKGPKVKASVKAGRRAIAKSDAAAKAARKAAYASQPAYTAADAARDALAVTKSPKVTVIPEGALVQPASNGHRPSVANGTRATKVRKAKAAIAGMVESGSITASEGLAMVAALG